MNVEILMKAGPLEANGQGKKKELFLSPKHYESSTYLEKSKMKLSNTEVDFERKVLQTAGIMEDGITRKDVMLQLSITKDQAYRLLQKLVEENKLQMIGSGRGTRYKI